MTIKTALATAGAVLAIAGCSPQFNDLEGVPQVDPDSAVVYAAPDGFPNISVVCIQGVAVVLTTRDYEPVVRIPELDSTCGSAR